MRIIAAGRRPWRVRAITVALAGLLAVAACSSDGSGDDRSSTGDAPVATVDDDGLAADVPTGPVTDVVTGEAEDSGGSSSEVGALPAQQADRSIIRTAAMTLTVGDVDAASVAVTRIAITAGGSVHSADVSLEPPAYAVVTVKVPPAALDATIAGVADLGTVTSRTQAAEDVTAQVVDLEARIASAEASLARVRAFLERAETVADLALLEAELTARETTLEQLQAQQRSLSEQVDLATLTVTMAERDVAQAITLAGLVETEPPSVVEAFGTGIAALGSAVWWALVVLAVLLPFLVVAAGIALLARWVVTHRRGRSAPSLSAATEPPAAGGPRAPLPPPPA